VGGPAVTISPEVPQVEASDAAALIASGAFLVDVREDDEWAAGRAPGATHVRLGEIPERAPDLPTDRTVVAVCRAGGRSQKAAEFLRTQGVDAVNLVGGMQAWAASGFDVVSDAGEPGTVI
jgi:rhodanese-related sulfurtransferase